MIQQLEVEILEDVLIFNNAASKEQSELSSHYGVCMLGWMVVCRQL